MQNHNVNCIPYYQVDAFTSQPFCGNPAGVCPLTHWLSDEVLQAIAIENNISETAFFVPVEDGYHLRWFTPGCEVDLCGHATLATAWVLFNKLGYTGDTVRFHTRSGVLTVTRHGNEFCMDFPVTWPQPITVTQELTESLGLNEKDVIGVWKAPDLIVLLKDKAIIEAMEPDMNQLVQIDTRGVVCTAEAADDEPFDFISRWFGPQVGVNEDPVTGSAHTWLVPLWSTLLNKTEFCAQQGGARKGELRCVLRDDQRVELYGSARMTIEGKFFL